MNYLKICFLISSIILAKNGLSQSMVNEPEILKNSQINNQITFKPDTDLNRKITALNFPPNSKFSIFDNSGKRIFVGKSLATIASQKLPNGFYRLKVYCLTGSWTIEIKEQD